MERETVADYVLTFRTLAAQTRWKEDTLKLLFCNGQCLELQLELACCDEERTLDQFIELAICINNLLCTRRPINVEASSSVASFNMSEQEPM